MTDLRLELSKRKEAQVTYHNMLNSTNERTFGLEKELKSSQDECNSLKDAKESMVLDYKSHYEKLSQVEQEVILLKETIEELKKNLQEKRIIGLLSKDQGFENTKLMPSTSTHILDLSKLDYFKVVVEGRLVDKVDTYQNIEPNTSTKAKLVSGG